MAADREGICAKWEQKYFYKGDWTRQANHLIKILCPQRTRRPHPEERPFGRVSKDGEKNGVAILRDAASRLLRMRAEHDAAACISRVTSPGTRASTGLSAACSDKKKWWRAR